MNNAIICVLVGCLIGWELLRGRETWKIVHIVDGDTIKVSRGPHLMTVRLFGIDCKDKSPADAKASKFLSKFKGELVRCKILGRDNWGRGVCKVWVRGRYLNQMLLDMGVASIRHEYLNGDTSLSENLKTKIINKLFSICY